MGLHGPRWLYVLGILPWGDVPLWTPRARATNLGRGPNLSMGSGRAPRVPRSREHELRPPAKREKNVEGSKKEHLYIDVYTWLAFWEWDGSHGVTQAGIPQRKVINRHPAVLLEWRLVLKNATFIDKLALCHIPVYFKNCFLVTNRDAVLSWLCGKLFTY